jgi:chromosome segregation ATPase
MQLRILKITMDNFKGIKHKEVVMDGMNVSLCAENGGFKTTTADAFYFCFADCNTAMVKNPDVIPIGAEECQPTVEIELTLDGKHLTVCKQQKYKKKEVDGKVTASTSNTYFINGIEKSYRDYVADLNTRGIDMDNFLIFSNPNAFMADTSKSGREKIRNILFKMCGNISDEDIVSQMGCADELKELIAEYRIDEIEQMNKSTLKKINDSVGKDNSIIQARIEELLSQKSTQDAKVLEEQKKNYEAEIERIEAEISNSINGKSDLMKKLSDARMERDRLVYEANNKLFKQKAELESAYQELRREISDKNFVANNVNDEIIKAEKVLEEANVDLEKQRELYKMAQDTVFDESDTICPTCKRELPKDEIEHLKAVFDKEKADRIKTLKASGKALNERIRALESEINDLKDRRAEFQRGIEDAEAKLEAFEAEINKVPSEADMSENETYQNVIKTISKLEAEVPQGNEERVAELKSQRNMNKAMLNQVIAELGYLSHNAEIDKRVEALREERKNAEIKRANAEKILDQIDTFKRIKNEMLTEEINKHFNIVKFKLFDYLKNGNYSEIVEILIDGKPMSSCANGSLIQLAKLDCLAGLQRFFNQYLSVFLEDAALITSNTAKRLNIDAQLVQLIAKDGIKDLEVWRN